MSNLSHLAELVRARNAVESNIANLLGSAVNLDTVGEFIAANVCGIRLIPSVQHNEFAGIFTNAALMGKTVDIRWYTRREGFLNVHTDPTPDYTLVLAGPKLDQNEARALVNPWIITSVYLFHTQELLHTLRTRSVRVGPRVSVNSQLWEQAEIFPTPRNHLFVLTTEQHQLLQLFG